LLDGIGKLVERGFHAFRQHFLLDPTDLHNTLSCVWFHLHIELQHLHAHAPHDISMNGVGQFARPLRARNFPRR